ncbi:hypothetical protein pneo_cds_853 [Pandoravirus neocaledonia]|uniref:Uncharacterized protein n=1 Tax=Pandoravirus neocaledonia TaxID=2107708 RepID=A0A2U7UDQ4_9VIRU|nr:hypothetical protein pneo_cds_853 [Pandoravirus neocaledonia]AVK76460.1 hypothetical protein pneo_cds_853 [Pandoravirus neocaledonia]
MTCLFLYASFAGLSGEDASPFFLSGNSMSRACRGTESANMRRRLLRCARPFLSALLGALQSPGPERDNKTKKKSRRGVPVAFALCRCARLEVDRNAKRAGGSAPIRPLFLWYSFF